ncbi:MAG: hypothetical protein ACLQBY_08105 [Solirubrobacteraceae bacterium]
MRSQFRVSLVALLVGALVAVLAPAAAQAAFGVESFASLTCSENAAEGAPKECNATTSGQFFTQAGGHPTWGITDFTFNEFGDAGNGVKTIRTDLPVGFSTNPQALPQCSMVEFEANLDKAEASHCNANTEAGVQEITLVLPGPTIVTLTGKVYDLVPATGLPLEFGIDVALPFLGNIHVHSLLEGGVSWHKEAEVQKEGVETGNYHEYFKIKVGKSLSEGEAPLLRSRLVFNGKADSLGNALLTNPTACPGPQTTHLRVESYTGEVQTATYTTKTSAVEENCGILKFEPTFLLTPSTTQQDKPDGVTTELKMPLNKESTEFENSDLKTSEVTLPEGLTINPSAASGLEVCTPEEFAVGTEATSVSCPPRSVIGTAVDNVPGLPPESLKGNIYLGETKAGPITTPPYTVFVEFASKRYGQMLRLEGSVMPNLETGQLKTTFANTPQGPFENTKLSFNSGPFANLANPLTCGAAVTSAIFSGYSGSTTAPQLPQFIVDSNGEKGACASPATFALTQSTSAEPATAGASTAFTFNLERPDGQQYLKTVKTELPPGLLGIVPSVTQCGEAQANAGTCPSSSKIGTVVAKAGSGSPYPFSGSVYFTGPYQGAPYGLSIVVPVVAGPFEFKPEVTRSKITVNPSTAQVIATTTLPTIDKEAGIPLRLRSLSVTINRQGFERNPTNCEVLRDQSTLTSLEGAQNTPSSNFQVEGCSALAFKPAFAASTSGKPSKAKGASLVTTLTQGPGQAGIKSVFVTLPKQLPSRLTTLQKACLAALFEANPFSCSKESEVGTATAVTPVLPGVLKGPAYLVSHGGEEFPSLELVLEANGVRVIVVGKTHIKNGITTTNFATTPDVPVTSVTVNLPLGPHSALAANGNLCAATLVMPTIITGQNGKQIKQNTLISPTGCGVQIVGHKVVGNTAYLTVKTFAAGRISGSGPGLSTVRRTLNAASKATTLKVPLSSGGRSRRRPFKVKIRVGFVPKKKGAHSTAAVTVAFR